MKLVGLVEKDLPLLQDDFFAVGRAKKAFLLRINELPEIVRLALGLKILYKLEVMNRNDLADAD